MALGRGKTMMTLLIKGMNEGDGKETCEVCMLAMPVTNRCVHKLLAWFLVFGCALFDVLT